MFTARGAINRETLPDANFVAGGLQTPNTTKFVKNDIVYLEGTGYSLGAQYEIIRALREWTNMKCIPDKAR